MSTVTRDELRKRLNDARLTILNVLPAEAFAQGRIPGSVNIPLDELVERAPRELSDKDREIVVYCGGPT